MERDALKTALATASRVQKGHEDEVKSLAGKLDEWEKYKKKNEKESKDAADKIDELRQIIKDQKAALAEKQGESTGFDWKSPWLWTVIAVTVAVVLAGMLIFRSSRPTEDYTDNPLVAPREPPPDSEDSKEPPEATNTN
jgi:hypothetical protein